MTKLLLSTSLFLMTACAGLPRGSKPSSNWIVESNRISEEYSKAFGMLRPEDASGLGFREFDAKAECFQADHESKLQIFYREWSARLSKLETETDDVEVKTDIRTLRGSVNESLEAIQLNQKYRDVAFRPVSKIAFGNLRQLINDQTDERKKRDAVERFKQYVFPASGCLSLADFGRENVRYQLSRGTRSNALYGTRKELELYLKESQDYLNGLRQLLDQSGRDDWQGAFEKFSTEVKAHDDFLKKDYLPKSRKGYLLPKEMYAFILKRRGIHDSPENLIARGKHEYARVFAEFRKLSESVAKKRGLGKKPPSDVIRALKKAQLTQVDELKAVYAQTDLRLKQIITEHRLASLPARPLKIRFAGGAESKAVPVPSLRPVPLVNNRGERPEFVVPTAESGGLPFDDMSYREALIGVLSHEGRPGHDLQFSSMLDRGVTFVRAHYAFNNVNAEGWGLHAEDMIFPYVSDEEKLVMLQFRLWRIARMFLDPEIQLGKIKADEVRRVFIKELGVSPVMTELEVNRYTFEDVGQAPSYFFGLEKLRSAQATAKNVLGDAYTDLCFNDFVLSLGLLPLDEVIERTKGLECSNDR